MLSFNSSKVTPQKKHCSVHVQGGRQFISVQFYCAYFLTASGWSELSIAVRYAEAHSEQRAKNRPCALSMSVEVLLSNGRSITGDEICLLLRNLPATDGLQARPVLWLTHRPAAQLGNMTVFYKQRDNLYFPVSAYVLPTSALRVPYSMVFGFMWARIVYCAVGMDPSASR